MTVRNNQTIWRVAQYIYEMFYLSDFQSNSESIRHQWYDKAAELLKKIGNYEFTGPDYHTD